MSSTHFSTADVTGAWHPATFDKSNSGTAANNDRVREQIETLDLDPIKVKLMANEGEGWSRRQADEADLMYRRFLYLSAKYPSQSIVPNRIVDIFWHAHILDTRKYAEDCEHIFGYFLHHFPYFGMRGEQDARELERAFAESNRLHAAEFGQQTTMVVAKGAKCKPPDPPVCDWDVGSVGIVRPSLQEKTARVCLYSA